MNRFTSIQRKPIQDCNKVNNIHHVSARNPQRYVVDANPRKDIPLRTLCSRIDKSRSHLAYGKMKLTFTLSMVDPSKLIPMISVKII